GLFDLPDHVAEQFDRSGAFGGVRVMVDPKMMERLRRHVTQPGFSALQHAPAGGQAPLSSRGAILVGPHPQTQDVSRPDMVLHHLPNGRRFRTEPDMKIGRLLVAQCGLGHLGRLLFALGWARCQGSLGAETSGTLKSAPVTYHDRVSILE